MNGKALREKTRNGKQNGKNSLKEACNKLGKNRERKEGIISGIIDASLTLKVVGFQFIP